MKVVFFDVGTNHTHEHIAHLPIATPLMNGAPRNVGSDAVMPCSQSGAARMGGIGGADTVAALRDRCRGGDGE